MPRSKNDVGSSWSPSDYSPSVLIFHKCISGACTSTQEAIIFESEPNEDVCSIRI
jgi:hypothetical protein